MLSWVNQLVENWQRSPSVLIVEDDSRDGELMYHTLTEYGCTVKVCDSVEDAVAHLRNRDQTIDIIFLDLKLHNKTGIEVLSVVNQICPRVPVVIVSGYATGELIEQALRLGYVGVVNKPLTKVKVDKIFNAHKLCSGGSEAQGATPG